MSTVKLQTALKLIRFNHDDAEVRDILQTAIDELDRLYRIEAQWCEFMASQKPAPDNADWLVMNQVAGGRGETITG